jgi:hypothetical protein
MVASNKTNTQGAYYLQVVGENRASKILLDLDSDYGQGKDKWSLLVKKCTALSQV